MHKIIEQDAITIAQANIEWSRFRNKTVLIAGANGYVPQYFIHGFLMRNNMYHENIHVIALCRNADKAKERFGEYYSREDFTLYVTDVLDEINVRDKIDYIIDAASPAGVKISNENPVLTFETNVLGCNNLLKVAKQNGAEFLFLSSVDIYGKLKDERFVEDKTGILEPTDVRNVYAAAKRASENLCVCYSVGGVISKIVRPSQIMGCGVALDDGRLHIDFISQILKKGKVILKGDGTPVRSFIYITDAVKGILYVMTKGKSGEAYNICTEAGETSVLGLAKMMVELVQTKNVEIIFDEEARQYDPAVKHAVSRVCADSGKLKSLGWKADVSLREACLRMMSYYEAL